MLLGVVEQGDVDTVDAEPREAAGEGAGDSLGAEVEDRPVRCQHPTDLRREDVVAAGAAGERLAEPLLGQAGAVEGCRVEEADPSIPGCSHGCPRDVGRDVDVECTGAEPDRRLRQRRAVAGIQSHMIVI